MGKSKQTYAALQYQYITDGLDIAEQVIDSIQQEQTDMGEVSDGYHTFNELYYAGKKRLSNFNPTHADSSFWLDV